MRSTLLVTLTLSLICLACTDRTVVGNDDGNTTTTNGDGDGDASSETGPDADLPWSGDGDGGPDPNEDACGCEQGQLCVGDCIWGDFNPNWVDNPRCINDAICFEHGFDSPECMDLACQTPWADPIDSCGDSAGYDIICDPASTFPSCNEVVQDCPDGEKCVVRVPDRRGFYTSRCVGIPGMGAPGEPCMSEGADPESEGTDSCDASSMCWSGTLTAEPFEGICRPFCALDMSCPDGLTCAQLLPAPFFLCVPAP
jgi:hypothetical protein